MSNEQTTDHIDTHLLPGWWPTGTVQENALLKIEIDYPTLRAALGAPNSSDDDSKVDVAWDFATDGPDQVLPHSVHVYNYKNGPAYNGEGRIEDVDSFSVQGNTRDAVEAFARAIEQFALTFNG